MNRPTLFRRTARLAVLLGGLGLVLPGRGAAQEPPAPPDRLEKKTPPAPDPGKPAPESKRAQSPDPKPAEKTDRAPTPAEDPAKVREQIAKDMQSAEQKLKASDRPGHAAAPAARLAQHRQV